MATADPARRPMAYGTKRLLRLQSSTSPLLLLLLLLVTFVALCSAQPGIDDSSSLTTYEILLRLYDSTRGTRWTNHSGWLLSEESICTWNGITCFPADDNERAGHVSEIDLSTNHMVGTFPSEVFDLPYLTSLSLNDNPDLQVSFVGSTSSTQSKAPLVTLSLTNTLVSTLKGIGAFATDLETLRLVRSQVSGSFPEDFFSLTKLTGLYLNTNSMTGTLSTKIGLLTKLEQFFVTSNQMEGQLPSELGLLVDLKDLTLTQNNFNGTLPAELNDCISLERLAVEEQDLENNGGLTGTLPALNKLQHITEVYLQNNELTGSLPDNFLAAAPKDEIVKLDLSRNVLTGGIPVSWTDFSRLRPLLEDNHIDEFGDDVCFAASDWMDKGPCPDTILCSPGSYAKTGRATSTENCERCDSAQYYGSTMCLVLVIGAGGDSNASTTPKTERAILEFMYKQMGGVHWKKSTKWLQEDDICEWYGITCNEDGKVEEINMKNNGLSNSFPSEIYSLPALMELTLNSNTVSFSFKGISKASNLRVLDLMNTGLSSLESVEELDLTNVQTLKLASNALQGEIPSSLFQLSNLVEINLSHNQFTGQIAPEVGQWKNHLERLSVYGSLLDGPLPTQLGQLTKLILLDLSENKFTGSLPTELEQLTALKSISIHQTSSVKSLTGNLLAFEDLTKLTSLHLESNDLSGALPPNFLANTDRGGSRVEIRLSDNDIRGVVPSEWADRFEDLVIDLVGNKISGLHGTWCSQQDWMDGAVGDFDCDAILCPAGTYNAYGRRQSIDSDCMDCPEGGNLMGMRECSSGSDEEPKPSSAVELKELYYATGGTTSWTNSTGWNHLSDYCDGWFGVICNDDGEVIKIDLNNNEMTGTITSSIFKLPALKELNLQGNHQLACSFDGIAEASNLEILWFEDVGLDSLAGISKAPNLQEVHLSNNDLTGSIPGEVFELSQLTYLSLNYNKFSGRLPNVISQLPNLEELQLKNNQISGQIPASIGSLKKLRVLSMSANHLTGTLPDELTDLLKLETLNLQGESASGISSPGLVGAGIRGPLLSFRNLPHLKVLIVADNSLTGTVPFDFLDGVEDKTKEILVNFSSNQLKGRLPASLTQFDYMNIYAAGNQITEVAPGLCKKEFWMHGLVKEYGCNAILCPPATSNQFGMVMSDLNSENYLCTDCTVAGAAAYYGSKSCLTVVEVVTVGQRETLKDIFRATGGLNWKVNTNWMDDSSSICSWFGVNCVSDEDESVETLHLPSNGLNGTVPVSIFKLESLKEIDFSGNSIQVNFGDEASAVTYINLDKTGMASLSGIVEAAPDLELLHITGNAFTSLPLEIFELQALEALYMSDNDFAGEFPTQLTLLSNLVYFACGDCGFEGTLPTSVGTLVNLEHLSLFDNSMTGVLPTEIENLSKLKFLDLSRQTFREGGGFSGTLPDFTGMPGFANIMLAWNSFTGSIPLTLLNDINSSEYITLDFRNNLLTGAIPSDLSRFTHMNLFLSSNMIDEIPQSVCDTAWNDPGPTQAGCNHILCAKGTFNAIGYASQTEPCDECSDVKSEEYFGSTRCGENAERDILSALYADLNGDEWNSDDGWLTDDDICTWYGITCFGEGTKLGRVQEIILAENNMVGTVSNDIYKLQYLESLELKRNKISLSFDGIGNATNLVSLHLSETPVKSLAGIGAAHLDYLHLTSCNITGRLPTELFDMTNLQGLYLNYNNFDGTLPTEIQKLANVGEFYLFSNKISGSIPTEIGMLSSVYILGLGGNLLTGTLPTQLNRLSQLQILSFQQETGLADAGLGGFNVGLSGPLLPLNGLSSLKELYLGRNSFQGTIPEDFISGVTNASRTIKVDLTNNKLGGSIPTSLARFDDLRLFLAGNVIEHIPDEVCDKHSWMDGLMDSGCDALLCEPGSFNEFGRRNSIKPCQPCAFNASSFFYGSDTCEPQEVDDLDERSILFQLYHSLDGNQWKKRDNWLEDNRPICSWHGVHCASEDNASGAETVVRLELPSNGLKGIIPAVVYHLPSLKVLNVRGNEVALDFHGADATKTLEELYLDKTKMSSLDGIGKIASLKILHLDDNDFGGDVLPNDLYGLSNLEILDLSNSGFGGKLPENIGSLTRLVQLFCHENEFSGTLPAGLGQLDKLEILQLSENTFVGNLPSEMSKMTALKSLFIDSFTRNGAGISGPLLPFSNMTQLRDLFLGSNTLTGTIPSDFLAAIEGTKATINIGLSGNSLTGTVPSGLARLEMVNIDLADNLFDAIDDSLCLQERWMGDAVKMFGCNAIMCPAGLFNKNGRQTSNEDPCIPCTGDGDGAVEYLGSTSCLALEQMQEKQILELFFQVTGGADWKEKDGWMDDNVGICEWHGISCKDDLTVESILLGSNNLSGRPPKELFEIKNLHFLWLYSNPIDFSFKGIERAKKLTSLLLDSTSLKSIEGIGMASSLSDVDIRFNSMTGTLPAEMRNLHELQSFSVGHNLFSGTVPSFANNSRLKTLRLGDNMFTGTVPDFAKHPSLNSLDLSDNKLSGTIPPTLLQSTQPDAMTFIDLSSNQLTGMVPGDIARHHLDLTIYLRDNKLEGIDDALCSAVAYNDRDVEIYGCDAILCPAGKYGHKGGRASGEVGECLLCPQAKYFGSSTCGEESSAPSQGRLAWSIPGVVIGLVTLLMM